MKSDKGPAFILRYTCPAVLLIVGLLFIVGCISGGSTGDAGRPNIKPSAGAIDYGYVILDHYKDQILTLINNGDRSGGIDLINPAQLNLPFSIIEDSCSGRTLAPLGECTLKLRFEPTDGQGSYTDSLSITGQQGTIGTISIRGNALALNVSINQVETVNCPDSIELSVSVTDRTDDPVVGLNQSNFTLQENSVLIDNFNLIHPITSPISVVLTLDYSDSTQPFINEIETAAKSFIELLTLNPDPEPDEAEIIKFAATVELMTGFSSEKTVLDSAIEEDPQIETNKTAFHDAVWQAIDDVSSRNKRSAVVVLSDGVNNVEMGYSLDDVVNHALDKGVPVFTIGVGDVSISVLQYLSDETGGQHFQIQSYDDLTDVFNRIASLLSNQYLIEYSNTSCGNEAITVDVEVELLNSDYGLDSVGIAGP